MASAECLPSGVPAKAANLCATSPAMPAGILALFCHQMAMMDFGVLDINMDFVAGRHLTNQRKANLHRYMQVFFC